MLESLRKGIFTKFQETEIISEHFASLLEAGFDHLFEHTDIAALDIPTIELAGGSVRCTMAGIHLAPRD